MTYSNYEYRQQAINLINSIAGPGSGLLKDDDAIGHITNKLIEADYNYLPDKGTQPGTLRYIYARNAICDIENGKTRRNKLIADFVNSGKAKRDYFYNADVERIDNQEEIEVLISKAQLNDRLKFVLLRRFLHNDTFREIANELKISKQRAKQLVEIGIKKLKATLNVT